MRTLHSSLLKFTVSAFALIVLLAASILLSPSTPVAQAQGPGGLTSLILQNLDPFNQMNARLSYFDANGQTLVSILRTVPSYRSITLDQPSQIGLPSNYTGAATVDSDTPFGGVVVEYNGNANSLGMSFQMDGYTAWPGPEASTAITFTQLLKNIYDPGSNATYNSKIFIQNSSPNAATVTIKYVDSSGQAYVHSGVTIPASGSYVADVASDPALSGLSTFFGIGQVSATLPIAAIVRHRATGILMSNSGFSSARAATTLYLTQVLKSVYDPISART